MSYSNFYTKLYATRDRVGASLREIFHFWPSRFYGILIIFWQLVGWFQAWFIYRNLSSNILVLHYNVDFGIDLVGDSFKIFLFPLLALLVSTINLFILIFLAKSKNFKIFVHFLLGSAVLFALFLSIALLAVYLINFR
jgi:hypothetical protein